MSRSDEVRTKALGLVDEAMCAPLDSTTPTSTLIRYAIRVARITLDYENLAWLEVEVTPSKDGRQETTSEIAAVVSSARLEELKFTHSRLFLHERANPLDDTGNTLLGRSVAELEEHSAYMEGLLGDCCVPENLATLDAYVANERNLKTQNAIRPLLFSDRTVLARIKERVVRYLTRKERELLFSDATASVFDVFRLEADQRLSEMCPTTVEMFNAAYRSFEEGEPESLSHALTSCRRLLKAVADALYPPRDDEVLGIDGKKHPVTDSQYINRLIQWVYENHDSGKTRSLLLTSIEDLGNRLGRVDDLTSKGIHDTVTPQEVRFGIIQTYILLAEIVSVAPSQVDDAVDAG